MRSLAYLSTPYTSYEGGDLNAAFEGAAQLTARLQLAGVKAFSPITHGHPIARYVPAGETSQFLAFNEAMMRAVDVLIVANLPGSKESAGVAREAAFFEAMNKPIYDLDCETLVMTRRGRIWPYSSGSDQ